LTQEVRGVLMLCYHYPPVHSAATARHVAFSTLLPEFGWRCTILTVRNAKDPWVARLGTAPESVHVVRTSEWALTALLDFLQGATRRALRPVHLAPTSNYYREIFGFPDPQIAWLTTARGICLAREHQVIYASCPPFSSALSALAIGAICRKPVVLDFRDAWSYDLARDFSLGYRRRIARLERLAVRRCARLMVTSEGARRLYQERYPACRQKILVVPNGYDELAQAGRPDAGRFRIVHVGTFYGTRDPRPLLRALVEIGDSRLEFVHVGPHCEDLDAFSSVLSIRQFGVLPRERALAITQTASLLYLRQGTSNSIAIAAKTYEYLATGLPVLFHGPEGDNAAMIRRYCVRPEVVVSDAPIDLERAVRSVLGIWPDIAPTIHPDFVRNFDRRHLVGRLAALLTRLVETRAGEGDQDGLGCGTDPLY